MGSELNERQRLFWIQCMLNGHSLTLKRRMSKQNIMLYADLFCIPRRKVDVWKILIFKTLMSVFIVYFLLLFQTKDIL